MIKRLSMTVGIRVLGAIAQLAMTFAVARLTGASEAGLFFFGYSIILILSALSRLGSELSGLRIVSDAWARRDRARLDVAVSARIWLTSAIALILTMAFWLVVPDVAEARFAGDEAGIAVIAIGASLVPLALLGLLAEILKAADRQVQAILLQNVVIPAFTLAALLLVSRLDRPGALATATAVSAATWIAFCFALVVWRRSCIAHLCTSVSSPKISGARRAEMREILRDAPSLLIVSSTSIVMQWIGAVLLGLFASPEQVAGYSVSVRLSIAVSIVHSAVVSIMAPRMAAMHSRGDRTGLKLLSHRTSAVIIGSTAPVLLILLVGAPFWLSFFGTEFPAFAPVLQLLVAGQLMSAMISHSGTILVMCGEYARARWTSIIAAAMLFGCLLVLVPPLGATGAALAMSSGVIAGHLSGLVLVRRALGFWSLPLGLSDWRQLAKEIS